MLGWKKNIFPVSLLFVLFLLDGLIASYFNQVLHTSLGYVAPRLTIVGLMLLSLYLSKGYLLTLTLVFGFLYDSYFTGFLGIYLGAICLMVYLIYQLRLYVKPSLAVYSIVGILMLTLMELFVFSVYDTINLISISYDYFFAHHLGGTLIFNGIVFVLAYGVVEQFLMDFSDSSSRSVL